MFSRVRIAIRFFFVGLAVGVLLAPRSGEETRRLLRERADSLLNDVLDAASLGTGASSSPSKPAATADATDSDEGGAAPKRSRAGTAVALERHRRRPPPKRASDPPRGYRCAGRGSRGGAGTGAPQGPPDPSRDRARMVAEQLEARGIDDPDILDAFRAVPRHAFVDGDEPYGDHAMPVGSGQTISQPYIVARMTQLGRPRDGWRGAPVLEIGTGSGYQAAILAELGADVTSIERHESLASDARARLEAIRLPQRRRRGRRRDGGLAGGRAVSVHPGDGGRSIGPAAAARAAPPGRRQAGDAGRGRQHQLLTLVERTGDDLRSSELEPVVFVPLIGHYGLRAD